MEEQKHSTKRKKIIAQFGLLIVLTGLFAYLVHYAHYGLGYFSGSREVLVLYAVLAFVSGYFGIRMVTDLLEDAVERRIGITSSLPRMR